jgi:hypothetical protein
MMRNALFVLLVAFMAATLCSCGDSQEDSKAGKTEEEMKRDWPLVPTDSVRIITLPTPMQVPALLRNTRATYNKEILFPIEHTDRSFFQSNVLFGTYLIDMAYTGSFGDQQATMEYFTTCKLLGDNMGLGMTMDQDFADRFTKNITKPDSLGRTILELYELGHHYFRDQDKEGIGLLMIMGCLFEGLHLGFAQAREHDLILFIHILSQQKQYTENLIYALDGYEIPSELQYEYDQLVKLDQLFMKLNPPSAYELKTGQVLATEINEVILSEIETVVQDFRASIAI